ncbi:MAG: hypothetical protein ACI4GD_10990 [Lachnospiraceae bacterium]
MSFCPKCKSEYINGRLECADCGTQLVETLDEIIEENSQEDEIIEQDETFEHDSFDEVYENDETDEENITHPKYTSSFVSHKERAKDHLSTGYTFLFVSIIGIIIITLNLTGVISIFHTYGASKILFYSVMYVMFIIFLLVSLNAFKNAKKINDDAQGEEEFIARIKNYIKDNIIKEMLEACVSNDSDGSEDIYFTRIAMMKSILTTQFPDASEEMIDLLIDETYDSLF